MNRTQSVGSRRGVRRLMRPIRDWMDPEHAPSFGLFVLFWITLICCGRGSRGFLRELRSLIDLWRFLRRP